MKPNPLFCLVAALFVCLTTSSWAKDDLPKREPFSHYEPMVKRSPFTVASAGGPVGATPDFAKNLYVANAAHSTDGDYVTIASTVDKNLKEYLNTRETIDGYSVSNIQWSDRVGETKVTITKDGQFATLTFNEALLSQALPAQPVPQPPKVPMRPPIPPQRNASIPTPIQRPMPIPRIPTPPPHTRKTIRRQPERQQPNVPPAQRQDDDSDDLDTP
jgi:hypothetical protein